MNKIFQFSVLITACVFLISCGSSSDSSSTPVSSDSEAVASSIISPGTSSIENATSDSANSLSSSNASLSSTEKTKGIVNFVAKRAIDRAIALSNPATKTISASDDYSTITFDNEVLTNPDGGKATVNGTLTNNMDDKGRTLTFTFNGDLTAALEDWLTNTTLGTTSYSESANGTLGMVFDGEINVIQNDDGSLTLTASLETTVTSSNIDVAGTVSGSGSMDMVVTISGDASSESGLSNECSGTATITTSAHGTETCEINEECTGCV